MRRKKNHLMSPSNKLEAEGIYNSTFMKTNIILNNKLLFTLNRFMQYSVTVTPQIFFKFVFYECSFLSSFSRPLWFLLLRYTLPLSTLLYHLSLAHSPFLPLYIFFFLFLDLYVFLHFSLACIVARDSLKNFAFVTWPLVGQCFDLPVNSFGLTEKRKLQSLIQSRQT